MSIENAKTFLGRVQRDPAMQQRIAAVGDPAKVTDMAAEVGLPCSAEEIRNVLREAGQVSGGLSDGELDAVAGGTSVIYSNVIRLFSYTPTISLTSAQCYLSH